MLIIASSLNLGFRYIKFNLFCLPNQYHPRRNIKTFLFQTVVFSRKFSHFINLQDFHKWSFIDNSQLQGQSIVNCFRLKNIASLSFRHFAASSDSMPRILNVAEKPDAAKTISQILSRGNSNRVRV